MNRVSTLLCGAAAVSLSILLPMAAVATPNQGPSGIGGPGKATAAIRTVSVTMGDLYFEPATVAVKPGETVRFVVKNTGELLHEFNIATAAMHAEHQQEMATMQEHGMITATGIDHAKMGMDHGGHGGHGRMAHDPGNSVLVEPGKTAELVWTFPTAVTLSYACNVPGHYEAGMVGTFTAAK